jgi:hypothetical protein
MEQLAETRSICLTEHTAKLVGGYFALRDLGESRIKGVSEPHELRQAAPAGHVEARPRSSSRRQVPKPMILIPTLGEATRRRSRLVLVERSPLRISARSVYRFVLLCISYISQLPSAYPPDVPGVDRLHLREAGLRFC